MQQTDLAPTDIVERLKFFRKKMVGAEEEPELHELLGLAIVEITRLRRPSPPDAKVERLRDALQVARAELHSWCGEGSGSQPVLDMMDAALAAADTKEAKAP